MPHFFTIKKLVNCWVVFFAAVLLVGCAPEESVVKDYVKAVAENRINDAMGYFTLTNVSENDLPVVKEKLLLNTNIDYATIQKNGGLESVSTSFGGKDWKLIQINAVIKYKNGKVQNTPFALVFESDKWKISTYMKLARDEAEEFLQAVTDNRIEEAVKYFTLEGMNNKDVLKGKILKHVNLLYSHIKENGGVESLSLLSIDDNNLDIGLLIKFTNGHENNVFRLTNEEGRWKFETDTMLAEEEVENYIKAISENRIKGATEYIATDRIKIDGGELMFPAGILKAEGKLAEVMKNVAGIGKRIPIVYNRTVLSVENQIVDGFIFAVSKTSVESFASYINENGGLDSVSATLVRSSALRADVEVYMKFKNGKAETIQISSIRELIRGISDQWKINMFSF